MSNESSGAARVVQMVACNGTWHVVMRATDVDPKDKTQDAFFTERVVAWLLIAGDENEPEIHPAVVLGTIVGDATTAGNYVGIIPVDSPAYARRLIEQIDAK